MPMPCAAAREAMLRALPPPVACGGQRKRSFGFALLGARAGGMNGGGGRGTPQVMYDGGHNHQWF